VDVRFDRRGVGADRGNVDRSRLRRPLTEDRIDLFPRCRTDRLEAPVEEGVVHHRLFPRAEEVLEELALRDPHHRLPQERPLDGMDHQGPQNRLGGEIPLSPAGTTAGEPLEVPDAPNLESRDGRPKSG